MNDEEKSQFYTSKEACELLHVDANGLRGYVKKGELERLIPPKNRRTAVYLRLQVDRLVRERAAFDARVRQIERDELAKIGETETAKKNAA